jgi:hypothetical protein
MSNLLNVLNNLDMEHVEFDVEVDKIIGNQVLSHLTVP